MRIGSLFSGIGGLELGLEWAEVGETVWQVEIDPFCRAVLAQHWPHATRHEDVRAVGAHNLEPVDVICGGFPCQDISYAGKGAGLEGARSGLWYEFARVVGEMGPRFVVVENVRALLTRGIDQVLGTLADLGYDAEWSTLRASDVGAPQRRERVFIVAYRDRGRELQRQGIISHECGRTGDSGKELEHATRLAEREPNHEGHAVADSMAARSVSGSGGHAVGDAEQQRPQGHAWHGDNRDEPERIDARPGGPTPSSSLRMGWHDAVPVRGADGTVRLIPPEAAAQGPESTLWPVVDGVPGRVARLRAIGNAVVPQVAEVVGRRLLAIRQDLDTHPLPPHIAATPDETRR